MVDVKQIQVIEGATNSTYDIYQVPQWLFDLIFPNDQDVAFLDEIEAKLENATLPDQVSGVDVWHLLYGVKVNKKDVNGIHGTLHLTGSLAAKRYYPDRKEATVIKDRVLR